MPCSLLSSPSPLPPSGNIQIVGPEENTTILSGTRVLLQCTLESAVPNADIEYMWSREGGNLPTNRQISGGKYQMEVKKR